MGLHGTTKLQLEQMPDGDQRKLLDVLGRYTYHNDSTILADRTRFYSQDISRLNVDPIINVTELTYDVERNILIKQGRINLSGTQQGKSPNTRTKTFVAFNNFFSHPDIQKRETEIWKTIHALDGIDDNAIGLLYKKKKKLKEIDYSLSQKVPGISKEGNYTETEIHSMIQQTVNDLLSDLK